MSMRLHPAFHSNDFPRQIQMQHMISRHKETQPYATPKMSGSARPSWCSLRRRRECKQAANMRRRFAPPHETFAYAVAEVQQISDYISCALLPSFSEMPLATYSFAHETAFFFIM